MGKQKYPIGSIFTADEEQFFRVVDYEKTLSDDADDHYKVCFDEKSNLTVWTKQSYLDKMELK